MKKFVTPVLFSDLRADGEHSENKPIKKASKKSYLKYLSVFVLIPIIVGGFYSLKNLPPNAPDIPEIINELKDKIEMPVIFNETSGKIITNYEEQGLVLGVGDSQAAEVPLASSENFKMKQMIIGEESLISDVNDDGLNLEISEIKSENFINNKNSSSSGVSQGNENQEVNLVISWRTNKLSMSQLTYSKSGGQNPKTIKEQGYGFNHTAIVSGLEPKTSYVYSIKCADRWGNEKASDNFGIYTPSTPTSVFTLISNAMSDVFGWAIKK